MSEQTLTAAPSRAGTDLVDAAWGLFTSVRLALVLILLITVAGVAGAAIAQAPPPALESEQQFALWVDQVRGKYGPATDVLARLQLFQVFSSSWFRILVVLLAANVLICTLHRTPRLLQRARRRADPVVAERMFDRAPLRATALHPAGSLEAATGALEQILRERHFVVRVQQSEAAVHVVGERNRYGKLGTLLTHTGIIAVLIGTIWGARGGFVDSQFVVAEGESRAVGRGTGLTIRLDSFADEYYSGNRGIPKDYRSSVTVLRDGETVTSGVIRVNEPLRVGGVRVHQAYYGPAIVMQVRDSAGNVLHRGPVPLVWRTQERPAGAFILPGPGLEVFIVGPASSFIDPVIQAGEVRLEVYRLGGDTLLALENLPQGQPRQIGDLEFTFTRESRFSGMQIVKDPSLPLIWIGCGLVVLGSIAVLYFPHRRLWARIDTDRSGRVRTRLAAARERGMPFESEFQRVANRVDATATAERAAPRSRK